MTSENQLSESGQTKSRELRARLLREFESHHSRKRRNRRLLVGGTAVGAVILLVWMRSFFTGDLPQVTEGSQGTGIESAGSGIPEATVALEYIDDNEALGLLAEIGSEGAFAEIDGKNTLLLVSDLP